MQPNLVKIYDQFINKENEDNRLARYEGNEEWFHGSASGMCHRKNYYMATQQEISNPRNATTDRLLRHGTIVHNDFQEIANWCLSDLGDLGGSSINKAIYSTIIELTSGIDKIEIEQEVRIPEFGVRGFYDIKVTMTTGEVYLYDVKTMNSWSWKYKFGQNIISPQPPLHHQLQLATYGYAVQKESDCLLDGMFLLYYNKDSSVMKEVEVPLSVMGDALEYWEQNYQITMNGSGFAKHPPPLLDNLSPQYDWECKYCSFKDYCKNDDIFDD